MKLVQTVVVRGEADILDAQIAFHLNAGVDFVIATAHQPGEDTGEILESYTREGYLHLVPEGGQTEDSHRRAMARLAATNYDADWVIPGELGEFWWPRGESLKEILAAIPERYAAVQGLVRQFVPSADGGDFFAERMTVRRSTQHDVGAQPATSLKAVTRTGDAVGVPLRAWYPIEIFRFPAHSGEPIAAPEQERGLADGSLVVDTRLRDALRALRASGSGTSGQFAVPKDGAGVIEFPTPDVVDDAAYAVECAAVGEVSLEKLERRIDELEAQLGNLERRFWTRVRVRVTRLGRSRRPGTSP